MYVLIYKDRVISGPRDWNRAMFLGALEDVGIRDVLLPRVAVDNLPYIINEDARIAECRLEYPAYNQKIEYAHGPFWDFSDPVALGTFQLVPHPIDVVRDYLRGQAAAERYQKEISGVKITIQGQEFQISTAREDREVYAQTAAYLADGASVNWKFGRVWLTINKTELQSIAAAVAAHVQSAFSWESAKVQEIDSAATVEELDAIVIKELPAQQ